MRPQIPLGITHNSKSVVLVFLCDKNDFSLLSCPTVTLDFGDDAEFCMEDCHLLYRLYGKHKVLPLSLIQLSLLFRISAVGTRCWQAWYLFSPLLRMILQLPSEILTLSVVICVILCQSEDAVSYMDCLNCPHSETLLVVLAWIIFQEFMILLVPVMPSKI
jgi:hypothetical protein